MVPAQADALGWASILAPWDSGGLPRAASDRRAPVGVYESVALPLSYPAAGGIDTARCCEGEYSKNSLAHQGLDLVSMRAEAEKHPLVDEHGRHGEAAGESKGVLASRGVAPDVAHFHRGAARLKEGEGSLAVRDAFHGEEHDLLHDSFTIPPPAPGRDGRGLLLIRDLAASV